MCRVLSVTPLHGYRLHVTFADGVEGEVDLSERLFGPMFEPLKNPTYFAQVGIEEFGAICWPNGADLAPDAMHKTLAGARQ